MLSSTKRISFAKFSEVLDVPNLIEVQIESYNRFCKEGIKELLAEVSPIKDFTGQRYELHFLDYEFREPKYSIEGCIRRDLTYASPLYFRVRLEGKELERLGRGLPEQWVYIVDFPKMTPRGTFIINGAERVVITQLLRSPGVYFTREMDPVSGRHLGGANLIPERGGWLEFETSGRDVLFLKIERRRRIPITSLLMAIKFNRVRTRKLYEGRKDVWEAMEWARKLYEDKKTALESLKQVHKLYEDKKDVSDALEQVGKLYEGGMNFLEAIKNTCKLYEDRKDILEAMDSVRRLYEDRKDVLEATDQVRKLCEEGKGALEALDQVYKLYEGRKEVLEVLKRARKSYEEDKDFLEALGRKEDVFYLGREALLSIFRDDKERRFIEATLDWADAEYNRMFEDEEGITDEEKALSYVFRLLRPTDPLNLENARSLINNLLFNPRQYDLGKVGRYKLNQRFGFPPLEGNGLLPEDLIETIRYLIRVNNEEEKPDDIDHLGNRRARTVGEVLYNQFRIGLLRMERAIKERMSITDPQVATPLSILNNQPLVSAIKEFFGTSQLSQFMDQTNPLAELTHKRRLSAMGPGGLTRERAGFEVRDVHYSHYGRICPIETPEGPNIGLITSLATYAKVNEFGFIETPYRLVIKELDNTDKELIGRRLAQRIRDESGKTIAESRTIITPELFSKISSLPSQKIKVFPFASKEIVYLSADKEEKVVIAQAHTKLNEKGEFLEEKIECRRGNSYLFESPQNIDYMDVSLKQIVGVSTSLIPFLEHDDANRALMGANMLRQAVPLIRPQAPIVGTGMEMEVAKSTGQALFARNEGVVSSVSSDLIIVKTEEGEDKYPLAKFHRTNQGTCFNQRPVVRKGDKVKKGDLLADSFATDKGELALGQNLLVAFMSWEGYNFEDAIIISERLVKDDRFTSIHIERYEVEARETKIGNEEITRDIPNVGEEALKDLDERGIIRVGAKVGPGDILVGKITPKGEMELTAEERLLRVIFGEKASDVKDSSLRVPHEEGGRVISVDVFPREEYPELPPGVREKVKVWVAQRRKITIGDKLAGRHGNKGVISIIVPEEDMPFLPDGRPVEIILNPIGVPSRMNLGQIFETQLEAAASILGWKAICPVFQGATSWEIEDALAQAWLVQRAKAVNLEGEEPVVDWEKAKGWLKEQGYDAEKVFAQKPQGEAKRVCLKIWLQDQGISSQTLSDREVEDKVKELEQKKIYPPISGKVVLRDGKTGEPFAQPVTVGYIFMMKLIHLVEDKIHARSTGPYSLITQQPLGGRSQFGGQRFGEMEVWALEAYGAAYTLQELLTVKSDDMEGRIKTYEALVKGEDILKRGIPESFKVLSMELKSLGLDVEILTESEERMPLSEDKLGRDNA